MSSVPAGTPLKGLGYIKGQEAPLAKEDSEYPSWLWNLLATGSKDGEGEEQVGDAYGKCCLFATLCVSNVQRSWRSLASDHLSGLAYFCIPQDKI